MNQQLLHKLTTYLQTKSTGRTVSIERDSLRALTISREAGAGAITVSRLVMEHLEAGQKNAKLNPWAVFNRSLVKQVLVDHLLPESIEHYFPEDAVNRMTDLSEEFFGLHPSSRTLVQKTNQTIFKLARKGNVILVGRGAHLVTAPLKHVLHVRLVASLDFRVRHIESYYKLTHKEAVAFARKEDRAKRRYLLRNFNSGSDDLLHFHLVVNTGLLGFEESARLIADAVTNVKVRNRATLAAR